MIYLDNDGYWWVREGEYVGGVIGSIKPSLTYCTEVFHQHIEQQNYTYKYYSRKYGVNKYVLPVEFIK